MTEYIGKKPHDVDDNERGKINGKTKTNFYPVKAEESETGIAGQQLKRFATESNY